jgi:phage shock protein PspC (stress-responsive transcriptional regulator)
MWFPGRMTETSTQPVLRRPRDGRMIAGVCAGVARYFGLDVALVRIIAVLLAVFGGSGILLYVIGWIAIPEGDSEPGTSRPVSGDSVRIGVGAVLLALGAAMLVGRAMPGFSVYLGPLLLVAVGGLLLVGTRR